MIEFRWCGVERVAELQAFIDEHWKRRHILARDADLLRWQHPRSAGELSILVAQEKGEMLGILGIVPADCGFYGERRPGAWLTTWVARADARDRHVGLALLRSVIDETDGLVATIGGNATTMRILGVMGFSLIPAVPRWVLPGSRDALRGLLGAMTADVVRVSPRARANAGAPGYAVVDWHERHAAAWDRAWSERFAPRLVGTWRDAAYLRWRYLEHPRFRYEVRLATRDGEVSGLLVYRRQRVQDRSEEVVRIVELLAVDDAAHALLEAVVDGAMEPSTALADFYCTSTSLAAPLRAAGFHDAEHLGVPIPGLFQPLDQGRTALTGAFWAPARWGVEPFVGDDAYVTRSDCDQDRPN